MIVKILEYFYPTFAGNNSNKAHLPNPVLIITSKYLISASSAINFLSTKTIRRHIDFPFRYAFIYANIVFCRFTNSNIIEFGSEIGTFFLKNITKR